jgi:hypothetical protein
MEVSGQLHAPSALSPGKEPTGIHWIGGWLDPESVWTLWRREKSCNAGNRTRVVQVEYLRQLVKYIRTKIQYLEAVPEEWKDTSYPTEKTIFNTWKMLLWYLFKICSVTSIYTLMLESQHQNNHILYDTPEWHVFSWGEDDSYALCSLYIWLKCRSCDRRGRFEQKKLAIELCHQSTDSCFFKVKFNIIFPSHYRFFNRPLSMMCLPPEFLRIILFS